MRLYIAQTPYRPSLVIYVFKDKGQPSLVNVQFSLRNSLPILSIRGKAAKKKDYFCSPGPSVPIVTYLIKQL